MKPAGFNAVNPFLKNRYADLSSIMEACRDLLAANDLSIVQLPCNSPAEAGPGVGLTTMIMHKSGEWIQDTFFLPLSDEKGKSTAQVAGSIITYARRYALAAMLGIVSDEDTDGNDSKQKPASSNGSTKASDLTPPMPTDVMKKKFHKFGVDYYGDSWDDERPRLVTYITNKRQPKPDKEITTSNELYRAEMQSLIDGLASKIDEREQAKELAAE
jgi:hypothetical protein